MIKELIKSVLIVTLLISGCSNSSDPENSGTDKNSSKSSTENVESKSVNSSVKGTINLTRDGFLNKVMNYEKNPDTWVYLGDKPCIIDFYADWCGPCRMAAPVLEELAAKYADQIYIYKIDTEKERQISADFGIQSIPAFLFVPMNGQPVMNSGIARTQEETKQMFDKMIQDILLNPKE